MDQPNNNPTEMAQQLTPEETASREAAQKGGVTVNGKPVGGEQPAEPQEAPKETPAEGAKERPEGVPEKFWNAETGEVNTEALLKSYSELEAKMSGKEENQEGGDENAPEGGDAPAPLTEAFSSAQTEYAETGNLSDETIGKLEAAGIDRATIDTYVAGVKAIEAQMTQQAYTLVGGEDNYKAMIGWAKANLSETEAAAFDRAVQSQDTMSLAIRGLYQQYQSANGNEPPAINGKPSSNSSGVSAFKSSAEMKAAMADPRYKTDASYRDDVAKRIALARQQGVNVFI